MPGYRIRANNGSVSLTSLQAYISFVLSLPCAVRIALQVFLVFVKHLFFRVITVVLSIKIYKLGKRCILVGLGQCLDVSFCVCHFIFSFVQQPPISSALLKHSVLKLISCWPCYQFLFPLSHSSLRFLILALQRYSPGSSKSRRHTRERRRVQASRA